MYLLVCWYVLLQTNICGDEIYQKRSEIKTENRNFPNLFLLFATINSTPKINSIASDEQCQN